MIKDSTEVSPPLDAEPVLNESRDYLNSDDVVKAEKVSAPREFDERAFTNQWVIRSIGMPVPPSAVLGASCYHQWFVKPALETTDVPVGLDHPCKTTCSGWQQGYERGLKASDEPVVPEFPLNLALAQIQKKLSNWNIPEATLGPMVLAAVSLTEWGFNRAIEMLKRSGQEGSK